MVSDSSGGVDYIEVEDENALEVVNVPAEVVKLRVRGKDFDEIAAELSLNSTERAREIFFDAMRRSYANSSPEELRFLQLKRMESLVDTLWDTVKQGDLVSEGRQTANLIKIIEEINKLMGLHRDPLVEAQVRLTEVQIEMIYQTMALMRAEMLQRALDGLRPVTDQLEATDSERVRVALESSWADWHQESMARAIEQAVVPDKEV